MSETDRAKLTAVPKQTTRGELRDVTFRTPQVIAGKVRPAGTTFKMYDSEVEALGPEARAQMIDAPSMTDIKVLYKRDADGSIVPKMVYDVQGYQSAIDDGFTPQTPENFTFVKMFRQKSDGGYETKVARSPEEMNRMIAGDYRVWSEEYKQVGNQLLWPRRVRVSLPLRKICYVVQRQGQPRVAKNKQEETAARNAGYHYASRQRRRACLYPWLTLCLLTLATTLREFHPEGSWFQSAVCPRYPAGGCRRGWRGLVTVGGTVPARIEAVRLAKSVTPTSTILACCLLRKRPRLRRNMRASLTRRLITPRLSARGTSWLVVLPMPLTLANSFSSATPTTQPTQTLLKPFRICNI